MRQQWKFENFEPHSDLVSFTDSLLELITDFTDSGEEIQALLRREAGDRFEATIKIKINGEVRTFSTVDCNPVLAIHKSNYLMKSSLIKNSLKNSDQLKDSDLEILEENKKAA